VGFWQPLGESLGRHSSEVRPQSAQMTIILFLNPFSGSHRIYYRTDKASMKARVTTWKNQAQVTLSCQNSGELNFHVL
jgi:hypothetical protein